MPDSFMPVPVEPPEPETAPADFQSIGHQIAAGVGESGFISGVISDIFKGLAVLLATVMACLVHVVSAILVFFGRTVVQGEAEAADAVADLAKLGILASLGVDVDKEHVKPLAGGRARPTSSTPVSEAIFEGLFGSFAGAGPGALKPGDEAVRNFVNAIVTMQVEDWIQSSFASAASVHLLDEFTKLGENMSDALGLGRIVRGAMRPAVDIVMATPYEWKLHKLYRPKLLTAAEAARQYVRGRMTVEQVREELARQGYSDERIEAVINASSKFLGVGDLAFLVRNQIWTRENAVAHLRDQGFSAELSSTQLEIERLKRLDAEKQKYLDAIVAAYIDRDIDPDKFDMMIEGAGVESELRPIIKKAAALRRELKIPNISETDAEQLVKRGFWTFEDYADYLAAKGWLRSDIDAKSFLLMDQIKEVSDAKALRDKQEKDRAKEKSDRAAAAKKRRDELEAERRLKEVSIAQGERAFVRGIISQDQYADFLTRQIDVAADGALLMQLALDARQDFLDAAQKRADAAARLASQDLSLPTLERAVEHGLIKLSDYEAELLSRKFTTDQVRVLSGLLQAAIADQEAAAKRRAQIQEQLATKEVSLATFEQAVLRGERTLEDYRQFLEGQKYAPEDQELLAALLQDRLDDQADGLAKRKDAEERARLKQITLGDLERAVLSKIRPMADYQATLAGLGYSRIDQDTLVRLLQQRIDELEAARKKRAEIDARQPELKLSIAQAERAARLGIMTIDAYDRFLQQQGMSAGDREVLRAIAIQDLKDRAEARVRRQEADAKLKDRPVPPGTLAQAVKQGLRPIADYGARLTAEGFSAEAVKLMVDLLQDEVDRLKDAEKRREELDAQRSQRELSRSELERSVRAGLKTLDDYAAFLDEQGYDADDRDLLVELLAHELQPKAAV